MKNVIIDVDLCRDIQLCIENNWSDLYHGQTMAIINNLAKKKAQGVFDETLAIKAFLNLVKTGLVLYKRDLATASLRVSHVEKMKIAVDLYQGYKEHIEEIASDIINNKQKKA